VWRVPRARVVRHGRAHRTMAGSVAREPAFAITVARRTGVAAGRCFARIGTARMTRLACAVVALATVGCAVGPRYHRPATQVTPTFRGQDSAEAASFADLPWWEAFGDEALSALIREALANSYDLAD